VTQKKALVTVGEGVTRAGIFGHLGGKLPKILLSNCNPDFWLTMFHFMNTVIRLRRTQKVPNKVSIFYSKLGF